MSWEYSRHEAVCDQCGKKGFRVSGSDDWDQHETRWEEFENIPPDPYEVGRMRVGGRDMRPHCSCGSTKITVGKLVERF